MGLTQEKTVRCERVLVIEDDPGDFWVISEALRRTGYHSEVVNNVEDAIRIASKGVQKVICDIRLKGPDDYSGLLCIRPILECNPKACILVCSSYAEEWRQLAMSLGAHEVIAKAPDIRSTLLEIDNHFLRHREDRKIFEFVAAWWGGPILGGSLLADLFSRTRVTLPFLSPDGSAIVPLALAVLFVLTVADAKGRSDRVISSWRPLVTLHEVRVWLFAAIFGGLVWDVVKHYLPRIVGG